MIRSMTGVGRAEIGIVGGSDKLIIEIKSSNHRFLEMNMKLPPALLRYENHLREMVRRYVFRGSLQISINTQTPNNKDLGAPQKDNISSNLITLDINLLTNLINLSKKLKEDYNIEGDLNVNTVISFPGVVIPAKPIELNKNEVLWQRTKIALMRSITAFNKMKREEGLFLEQDFSKRIKRILMLLKDIEKRTKKIRQEIKERILEERGISAQTESKQDINNLQTYALQRIDISEERIRLLSHTKAFLRSITSKKMQSVGRKLEFILSEMLRETETMLAKARDTVISRDGIAIKEEIDALREQVRNVE